jgi:hypothetical protein
LKTIVRLAPGKPRLANLKLLPVSAFWGSCRRRRRCRRPAQYWAAGSLRSRLRKKLRSEACAEKARGKLSTRHFPEEKNTGNSRLNIFLKKKHGKFSTRHSPEEKSAGNFQEKRQFYPKIGENRRK